MVDPPRRPRCAPARCSAAALAPLGRRQPAAQRRRRRARPHRRHRQRGRRDAVDQQDRALRRRGRQGRRAGSRVPAREPEVPRLSVRRSRRSCASTPAPATIASTPRAWPRPCRSRSGPAPTCSQAGSANDTVTTVADGQRDVVDCGAGQDTVEGMADPNDELAATCETAQRSFEPAKLPKALTVGPTSTITVAIGRADVPLSFAATLATAPPKGSQEGQDDRHHVRAAGHRPREAALQAPQAQHRLPQPPPRRPRRDRRHRHHGRRPALPAQPPLRLAGASSSDRAARQPAALEDPRQAAPPARALTNASASSATPAGAAT